jgi:peptide/nickel transport system permease protein
MLQRYFQWLVHAVSGSFGTSLSNNMPVRELIATRLPNMLTLAGLTAAVSVPVALAIGIFSAMYRGLLLDRVLNVLTLSTVAVPEFLIATIAVPIFAVKLRWLSALSYLSEVTSIGALLRIYAMPLMTLCCVLVAQMARMTRAAVLDQLNTSYVEMAVLKGASPMRIVLEFKRRAGA